MYEICLHKTGLILVWFRNNLQYMLFNLWFENISYLRNSYSMEPIFTTILKIQCKTKKYINMKFQEQENQQNIPLVGNILKILLKLVSREICVKELIKMQ